MDESVVDADTVRHVAELARIDLDADELDEYRADFAEILAHFDRLEDVPDIEADPRRSNVFRDDAPRSSLSQHSALANAAEHEDGRFRGPPVS